MKHTRLFIYWPAPGFKGKTFELWVLNRWVFNFCVRSTPWQGIWKEARFQEKRKKKSGLKRGVVCSEGFLCMEIWREARILEKVLLKEGFCLSGRSLIWNTPLTFLCGWLGLKQQLTNWPFTFFMWRFIFSCKWIGDQGPPSVWGNFCLTFRTS